MPAPPVPLDQVEMTFLLKYDEKARKVGSPSPDAKDVIATPPSASHWVLAKATVINPQVAMMHDTEMRTLKVDHKLIN